MLPSILECSRDAEHRFDPAQLMNTCPHDDAPLLVRYDVAAFDQGRLSKRPWTMWRYREMLPIGPDDEPISLGEGGTPLLRASKLEALLGKAHILIKDEAQNPTGSFKARGMSAAVTRAKALGATALVAPSAGNAGGAMSAYGARAGLPVHVFLPKDTPAILIEEARTYGAQVHLVDGLIDDAGKAAGAYAKEHGAFNLATLREPYRVEGKKTMGYELVEQLGTVPGTIVYPTGGGTGLIGMWKAFDELQRLHWIGAERPHMISVQAEGCAPIVRAFANGAEHATRFENAATAAWGLRVPAAIGDRLMLRAIRDSGGTAVAVSEEAMAQGMHEMRTLEGVDASEEGGAAVAALRALIAHGVALPEPIVLFNTGSALKYAPRA